MTTQVLAKKSMAQPAISLGLTLLLIGLAFAIPLNIVPLSEIRGFSSNLTTEVGNVYAITAWAGWAHFIFAFRGQGNALMRLKDDWRVSRLLLYATILIIVGLVLAWIRSVAGLAVFSAVVWIYFIDHFLKAVNTFRGGSSGIHQWLASYQTLFAFGWLTVVLLNVANIVAYPWLLWGVSLFLALFIFTFGGWRTLGYKDSREPLIALFFVAEALVWGTISRYGESAFLSGVYIFHIAAGSFLHYLGSYFFAISKTPVAHKASTVALIVLVNAAVILVGAVVCSQAAFWCLTPVLGLQWFTLWVALHLVSSDLFPMLKRWNTLGTSHSSG
ncbi:MAG TPA: hypothetical protein VJ835_01785 [Fimbriimonadaceae bacterium]|nr:hypothetical protein [Fimbriimonadaceae bacterium]